MNITSAQYQSGNASIKATIDGEVWVVPVESDNRHYAEILKQVEAGTLTIKEAD